MRGTLRTAALPFVAVACVGALIPILGVVLFGPGGIPLMPKPSPVASAARTMLLVGLPFAMAWMAGVLASVSLWQAGKPLRQTVLAAAVAMLVIPRLAGVHGLMVLADWIRLRSEALALPAMVRMAGVGCVTLLVMSAFLSHLDRHVGRTAAASGATAVQTFLLVLLPRLVWPLTVSVAACAAYMAM